MIILYHVISPDDAVALRARALLQTPRFGFLHGLKWLIAHRFALGDYHDDVMDCPVRDGAEEWTKK